MLISYDELSIKLIQENNPPSTQTQNNNINDTFLKNAEIQTIELVKDLFKGKGKWNEINQYNLQRFFTFFKKLDEIWQIKTNICIDFSPHAINNKNSNGGGSYHPGLNMLLLNFPSLMTALHEWKHRIQFAYPKYSVVNSPSIDINSIIEPDAIIWSHTIFEIALPILYKKNISKGKFSQIPNNIFPLKIFNEEIKNQILKKQQEEGIKILNPLGQTIYHIKIKNNTVLQNQNRRNK